MYKVDNTVVVLIFIATKNDNCIQNKETINHEFCYWLSQIEIFNIYVQLINVCLDFINVVLVK